MEKKRIRSELTASRICPRISIVIHLVGIAQPDRDTLASEGIREVVRDGLTQPRRDIGPVDRGHQRGDQHGAGGDDVLRVVLVVAVVGAGLDVVAPDLGVDVVSVVCAHSAD